MLTKLERKRLAREARKLAMECVEGGPQMDAGSWCGCAIGTALKRARLLPKNYSTLSALCNRLEYLAEDHFMLTAATAERVHHGNPTAVVFPLLAWADALEGK